MGVFKSFKRKKNEKKEVTESFSHDILKGVPRINDLIANHIDRSNAEYIKVGRNYCKSLFITGYPREVEIGWLNPFLEHRGDIDRVIHVNPFDDRKALDELARIVARLEAELTQAQKTGDLSMIQELTTARNDAWAIRELIATNKSRFYSVSIMANLYNTNLEKLEEEGALLEGALANRSIYSKWAEGRMDEAFLSVTPLGLNLCDDITRGFDSYALSTMFLFLVSDLDHKNGVPIALNTYTGKFLNFDPFDESLDNYNQAIFAGSGKGKSTLVKTMESRMQFVGKAKGKYQGEKLAIIDPMGEFVNMTQALDGVNLDIGPGSPIKLNPCDIAPEFDKSTKEWVLNIGDKISNMTLLTSIMCNGLSEEELSLVDKAWKNVYTQPPFSFTEDPESLYEFKNKIDSNTGNVEYGKVKKRMPQLSDFYNEIQKMGDKMERVKIIMERYLASNPSMGFFDCQTNVDLQDKRVFNFVVNRLEKNARVVGMFSVLSWIEDNFVKKDANEPGRVIIDEAWIFTRSSAAELTMNFLESLYRRARHFKKGITIISQDFQVFARHEQGRSIFQNSDVMFFLNNHDAEIKAIGEFFNFSNGVLDQIRNSSRGEGIMKVKDRFYAFKVINTPMETNWVYSTKKIEDEDLSEVS